MTKDFSQLFAACGITEKEFSKYFKAIGDPTRQKILAFLSLGEKTVSEIVKAVGHTQPTISRHLAVLKNAQIVIDERKGRCVCYALNKTIIRQCCISLCNCLNINDMDGDDEKKEEK